MGGSATLGKATRDLHRCSSVAFSPLSINGSGSENLLNDMKLLFSLSMNRAGINCFDITICILDVA